MVRKIVVDHAPKAVRKWLQRDIVDPKSPLNLCAQVQAMLMGSPGQVIPAGLLESRTAATVLHKRGPNLKGIQNYITT